MSQDIMTRHWRMRGHASLWVPGTDHAGIATQVHTHIWQFIPASLSLAWCNIFVIQKWSQNIYWDWICVFPSSSWHICKTEAYWRSMFAAGGGKIISYWRREKDRSWQRGIHETSLGVEVQVGYISLHWLDMECTRGRLCVCISTSFSRSCSQTNLLVM
jgi:hypothetical protein